MTCTNCHRPGIAVFRRGLCRTCYRVLRRERPAKMAKGGRGPSPVQVREPEFASDGRCSRAPLLKPAVVRGLAEWILGWPASQRDLLLYLLEGG